MPLKASIVVTKHDGVSKIERNEKSTLVIVHDVVYFKNNIIHVRANIKTSKYFKHPDTKYHIF